MSNLAPLTKVAHSSASVLFLAIYTRSVDTDDECFRRAGEGADGLVLNARQRCGADLGLSDDASTTLSKIGGKGALSRRLPQLFRLATIPVRPIDRGFATSVSAAIGQGYRNTHVRLRNVDGGPWRGGEPGRGRARLLVTNDAGHSFYDNLKTNADGSINPYFWPEAPAGQKSNWLETFPGRGFYRC